MKTKKRFFTLIVILIMELLKYCRNVANVKTFW